MENKFINDATTSILRQQIGTATTQRLDHLEQSNQEIVKFIDDYEQYLDSSLKELTDLAQANQKAIELVYNQNRQEQMQRVIKDAVLFKNSKIALVTSLISAGVAVGIGLAIFIK